MLHSQSYALFLDVNDVLFPVFSGAWGVGRITRAKYSYSIVLHIALGKFNQCKEFQSSVDWFELY